MAQHDQLDVLDLRGPAAPDQQLQHGYKDEVDEGEEHPAMHLEPTLSRRSARITVLAPFTVNPQSIWIDWLPRVRMSPACNAVRPTRAPFTMVPFVEARSWITHAPSRNVS